MQHLTTEIAVIGAGVIGLAVAEADAALLVADHHQGGEAEATATLNGRRDAIDVHQLFDDAVIFLFALATTIVAVATTATTAFAAFAVAATATTATTLRLTGVAGDVTRHVDGIDGVFVSHDQNSSPPSRAASASALTRPWNRNPPRSNTTVVTPAFLAASAIALPTSAAASTFAPLALAPSVEAAATVRPAASSMIWA
mgnify:CR=1 FL=1